MTTHTVLHPANSLPTPPRFTPPPPARAAHRRTARWLRALATLGACGGLIVLAHRLAHTSGGHALVRLAQILGRIPAMGWLPVPLVIVAAMVSAGAGLGTGRPSIRTLLPLVSLAALPLARLALLAAWPPLLG